MEKVTFSGIRMKVVLEGEKWTPYIRCPVDGTEILLEEDGNIILQDCEHLHWLYPDDPSEPTQRYNDDELDEYADFDDFLKRRYITTIMTGQRKLYLAWFVDRPAEGGFSVRDGRLPHDGRKQWVFFLPPGFEDNLPIQ